MDLSTLNEGWEDGPTNKRELKEPANIKKDSILFVVFGFVCLGLFVIWELVLALASFMYRLVARPEPKSLKGRVCLVTGAGRGLGREFCLALAREGAIIACLDINEPNNKTTAKMVEELGAKVVPYTVNIAIKNDVEKAVSKVEKELGPVYLLINNAAVVYTTTKVDEGFIRAAFNVNVMGTIWMMNAVLPTMKSRNEGHIVNISSIASKLTLSPLLIYGATKTSLAYVGDCVRAEMLLANKDINVTNVHPTIMNSSEDYVRFASLRINLIVEMKDVVDATMDAIHYNYDEVIIPSLAKYPLLLINEMMPSRTAVKLMMLIADKISTPNEQQAKNLPWTELIKECSLIENRNGS